MQDKELILKNSFKLKGSKFQIKEQYPKEIENKRKSLYPVAKRAKKNKCKVLLLRDNLFIDGKLYTPNSNKNYNCTVERNLRPTNASPHYKFRRQENIYSYHSELRERLSESVTQSENMREIGNNFHTPINTKRQHNNINVLK